MGDSTSHLIFDSRVRRIQRRRRIFKVIAALVMAAAAVALVLHGHVIN